MPEELNKNKQIKEQKKEEEKKELEVVTGDGSELDISPAYEHLTDLTPNKDIDKPKDIIIPKENKKI